MVQMHYLLLSATSLDHHPYALHRQEEWDHPFILTQLVDPGWSWQQGCWFGYRQGHLIYGPHTIISGKATCFHSGCKLPHYSAKTVYHYLLIPRRRRRFFVATARQFTNPFANCTCPRVCSSCWRYLYHPLAFL